MRVPLGAGRSIDGLRRTALAAKARCEGAAAALRASGIRKSSDLLLGGKSSRLVARVLERAVDAHVELAGLARLQLDGREPLGLQRVPHPEGLRQVASTAAVFDEHVHVRAPD